MDMNGLLKYQGVIPRWGAVHEGMQSNALIPSEKDPIWEEIARRSAQDEVNIGLVEVVVNDIPAAVARIKDDGLARTLLELYNRLP